MADPTTESPASAGTSLIPTLTNHPAVSAGVYAGAVASVIMAIAKTKFGFDLAGQEANITIIIMGGIGFLTQAVAAKKS